MVDGSSDTIRTPQPRRVHGRWTTRRLTVLALLALAALAAGFVDAVVGGGGLIQLPALLLGLPDASPGADPGHQQAGLDLRHLGQLGDLLPPGAARPAHVPAADGCCAFVGLGRRCGWSPRQIPREAFDPIVLVVLVVVGAYVLLKPDLGARPSCASAGRRHLAAAHGRRVRDRLLRRRAGPRHRQLPRLRPGRAARLQLPRGLGQGPAGQLGHQPRRALCVFVPQGAVLWKVGAGDGRGQPGRRLRRRARTAVSRGAGFVRVFFIVVVAAFVVRIGGDLLGLW